MLLISTVQILLNTISTTVRGYLYAVQGLTFRFRKIMSASLPGQNLLNFLKKQVGALLFPLKRPKS